MTGEQVQRTARGHEPRRVIVHDGVAWTVYERGWQPFDRRSARRLVFECDSAVRVVRGYPADWIDLGDDALMELSWRR